MQDHTFRSKENHPDLHPGDKAAEARFKEVNEAYEILSNSDKRSRYDQFGFAGVDPNYAAQNGGYGGGFDGGFDFGDLGDIFGSFFGGGFGGGARTRNGPQRGYLRPRRSWTRPGLRNNLVSDLPCSLTSNLSQNTPNGAGSFPRPIG